jgi:hypothetical protein
MEGRAMNKPFVFQPDLKEDMGYIAKMFLKFCGEVYGGAQAMMGIFYFFGLMLSFPFWIIPYLIITRGDKETDSPPRKRRAGLRRR